MRLAVIVIAPLLVAAPAVARAEIAARDQVNGGDHWRLATAHGAMHVWRPPGYDADAAGIVVYVHGLFTNVDEAWTQHKLADQFATAGKNALYIVPEAPVAPDDEVMWDSLGDVIRVALADTGLRRPGGELVVVGHSRAYRTVVPWLDYTPLGTVILLDAFYGSEEDYWDWLTQARGHAWHRLTIVAWETTRYADPFVKRFLKDGAALPAVPEKWEDLRPDDARALAKARVVYVKSQYGHMQIVTDGKVLPVMLKRTPLKDLPAPRAAP